MLSKIESRNISIIANRLNIDKNLIFELYDYDLIYIKKESILTNKEVSLLENKVLTSLKELEDYKKKYVDIAYIDYRLGVPKVHSTLEEKKEAIDIIYYLGKGFNMEVKPVRILKSGQGIYNKELIDKFIIEKMTTVYVNNKTKEKRRTIYENDLKYYMGISDKVVQKIIELGLLKEWSVYDRPVEIPKEDWSVDLTGIVDPCDFEEIFPEYDLEDVHDLMKVPNLEEKILKDDIETILADLIDIEKDTMQNEVRVYVETPKKETKVVLNETNKLDIEDI